MNLPDLELIGITDEPGMEIYADAYRESRYNTQKLISAFQRMLVGAASEWDIEEALARLDPLIDGQPKATRGYILSNGFFPTIDSISKETFIQIREQKKEHIELRHLSELEQKLQFLENSRWVLASPMEIYLEINASNAITKPDEAGYPIEIYSSSSPAMAEFSFVANESYEEYLFRLEDPLSVGSIRIDNVADPVYVCTDPASCCTDPSLCEQTPGNLFIPVFLAEGEHWVTVERAAYDVNFSRVDVSYYSTCSIGYCPLFTGDEVDQPRIDYWIENTPDANPEEDFCLFGLGCGGSGWNSTYIHNCSTIIGSVGLNTSLNRTCENRWLFDNTSYEFHNYGNPIPEDNETCVYDIECSYYGWQYDLYTACEQAGTIIGWMNERTQGEPSYGIPGKTEAPTPVMVYGCVYNSSCNEDGCDLLYTPLNITEQCGGGTNIGGRIKNYESAFIEKLLKKD